MPSTDNTDKEEIEALVKSAQKGDEAALRALIEATQEKLYRFCLFLSGNPPQSDDLLQDIYIQMIEKISQLRDPRTFESWLFRIARNRFLNMKRSEKIREYRPLEDVATKVGDNDKIEGAMEVEQILAELSEADREVLLLVDMVGKTYTEAAEIIGVSESALTSRLNRARKRFSEIYERERNASTEVSSKQALEDV